MLEWKFKEKENGEIQRVHHTEEFFDSVSSTEAVIREAIQNSMDARTETSGKVTVVVTIGETGENGEIFFRSLGKHLASVSLLPEGPPDLGRRARFLSIEDFNTTGLDGARECRAGSDSRYCTFWWYDGQVVKSGAKGGRWGQGKYVFFQFSEIKSFFGLSTVSDGVSGSKITFLLGRSLLRPHVIDGTEYSSDGVFGDNYSPVYDSELVSEFRKTFGLKRDGETGFSIVIPYFRYEKGEGIVDMVFEIVASVTKHFMYPLLRGDLEVLIYPGDESFGPSPLILGRNFVSALEDPDRLELPTLIQEWMTSGRRPVQLKFSDLDSPEPVAASSLPGLAEAREIFERGGAAAFRISDEVRYPGCSNTGPGEFNVILRRSDKPQGLAYVIRYPVSLPDESVVVRVPNTSAVILVESRLENGQENILNQLLGDAENISHSKWTKRSGILSGKGCPEQNPTYIIELVRKAPRIIREKFLMPEEKPDRNLLADYFFRLAGDRPGQPSERTLSPPPSRDSKISIFQIAGGFTVKYSYRGQDPDPDAGSVLEVVSAYRVRGSAAASLRSYSKYDFDLADRERFSIEVLPESLDYSAQKNIISVPVTEREITVRVQGFDPRRDLVVKAKLREGEQ